MTGSLKRRLSRWFAAAFAVAFALTSTGCTPAATPDVYTDYGTYGSDFAQSFASAFPFHKAFTAEEGKAADFIAAALSKLGYSVETADFDEAGQAAVRGGSVPTSRNIVVRIPGQGFQVVDADGATSTVRRTVLLCAHYDNAFALSEAEAYPGFDGIQDNASGVAALMQVAETLKKTPVGFDTVIAFYGAGDSTQIGAAFALSKMTLAELAAIEAVYCVDSIYAGDKLYADAGWNSTEAGRKYAMRKKLYEMTDIAIKYSIDLRTNQAGFDYDLFGTGVPVLLREVSTNRADYSPYDAKGLPCVFFESFDFFAQSVAGMAESRNPAFSATNGQIRDTVNDSSALLEPLFEENRLQTRINEVAFLLVKMVERGMDGGVAAITPPAVTVTSTASGAPTATATATPAGT